MGILTSIIGGPLLDSVKGIIAEFKLDPTKKAELESHLADLEAAAKEGDRQLEQKQLDLEDKLNDVAGQNIRTDSSSSDWFVRRARPFFIWIVAAAIGIDLLIFPLVNAFLGKGLIPIAIPADILTIFKFALLGYTGCRTAEKLVNKA